MTPSNGSSEPFATRTEKRLKRFGTTWPSKPHLASDTSRADTVAAVKSRRHIQQVSFSADMPLIARNDTKSFMNLKFKLGPGTHRLWSNIPGEISTSARQGQQNER